MTATRAEYFARWSALHGGFDPTSSRTVTRWLTVVHACARPLARAGLSPSAVTVLGLVLSGAALAPAAAGGGWLYAACALVVLSGLVDGLDGAVAVLTGRASALGHVLDSVVDRCSDVLYLVALWLAGAPAAVCVGAGVVMFLHEYLRARAAVAGMTDVGTLTVWERPTRVVVTSAALLAAAVFVTTAMPSTLPGVDGSVPSDRWWAAVGAWAWLGLGAVGLAQLAVVVVRRLSGRGPVAPG